MTRQIHDLQQGSEAWHAFRFNHYGASEAGIMMGLSRNVKRTELLRIKQTGIAKEYSDFIENVIFQNGHRVEELARSIVEKIIDDEFYPAVYSIGNLSASCDGITLDESIAFECKQFNQEYFDLVSIGKVPDEHMPQCQQILMVTEAKKLLFTISDGTPERTIYTEVFPDKAWFERIKAAWIQFEEDLEIWIPEEHQDNPIAEATDSLPMLSIRVNGELSIISNLDMFGDQLRHFVGNITKNPQDDQDFANLESACKKLKEAEEALEKAETYALAQIEDVNVMRKSVNDLKELARSCRLTSEKLVKTQKEVIKLNILNAARDKYRTYLAELLAGIKNLRIDLQEPDFGGAMKNKRTISSLHDAVDTLLANSKIEAKQIANDYKEKLAWLEQYKEYQFLFNDLQTLITNDKKNFELIITSRIDQHLAAEKIKFEQAEKASIEREAMLIKQAEERSAKEAEERVRLELAEHAKAEQFERECLAQEEIKASEILNTIAIGDKTEPLPETKATTENYTVSQENPGRNALISQISIHFKVSFQLAEQWLVQEFGKKLNNHQDWRLKIAQCKTKIELVKLMNEMPQAVKHDLKETLSIRQVEIKKNVL